MTKLMIRYSSIIWNEDNAMHVVFDDVSSVKIGKIGWFLSKGKTNQYTVINKKKYNTTQLPLML